LATAGWRPPLSRRTFSSRRRAACPQEEKTIPERDFVIRQAGLAHPRHARHQRRASRSSLPGRAACPRVCAERVRWLRAVSRRKLISPASRPAPRARQTARAIFRPRGAQQHARGAAPSRCRTTRS
jgi:hypothetical protein